MRAIETVELEYGVPATVAGAMAWSLISAGPRVRRYQAAGLYVAACRRLDPALWAVDGRLIAAGWNRVPPREWVRGERLDGGLPRLLAAFAAWWTATQPRAALVGSSYNATPEIAFALWGAGPSVRHAARMVPAEHWTSLVTRQDDGSYRPSPRGLRHARAIGIALRRGSAHDLHADKRALRRLGGLCPELQRVALAGAQARADARRSCSPVRLVDLDWAGVAVAARQLAADVSGRVRAAMAWHEYDTNDGRVVSRRFRQLCERHGDERAQAAWLAPSYPLVSLEQATRICRGGSPVQLSSGDLSRREAHEWLSTAPQDSPVEWLSRELPEATPRLRSVAVARWLIAVRLRGGWGGLTRVRREHGPAGQTIDLRFVDKLDEIQDVDLEGPGGTSVDAVFRRAAERVGGAWLERAATDSRVLADAPAWLRLYPRCMRVLQTPAELVAEGRAQGHCVGGYAHAVEHGQSVIVSINVFGQRSTVELSARNRTVLQHRGQYNAEPPAVCERALRNALRRSGVAA